MKLLVTVITLICAGSVAFLVRSERHDAAAAELPSIVAPAGEPTVTLEQYFESLYGTRWPELRARLDLGKCSLKTRVVASKVPTWESARSMVEADFGPLSENDVEELRHEAKDWRESKSNAEHVDFTRPEYNPEGKELGEQMLAELREVARSFDEDLDALVLMEADALGDALRTIWREERYTRCPFGVLSASRCERGKLVKMRIYDLGVWKVCWSICEGEFPMLDAARAEIGKLRAQRLAAVLRVIARA